VIDAKSHLQHLAVMDAEKLATDYDTLSADEWEEKAQEAWVAAVEDVGLSDRERKELYAFYLRHLTTEVARLVDACQYVPGTEADEQTCFFCSRTVTRDRAVEDCWTPDFWFNDQECADSPACPECAALHLDFSGDEPVMKDPRS
jgi:hypothetical protein